MKPGAHLSIGQGLTQMLATARVLGCEAVQVFSRSPRGGKARAWTGQELEEYHALKSETGIEVVVHVPYYLNLASSEARVQGYSRAILAEDLIRTGQLGGRYLVTHIGHHSGDASREGLLLVAQSVQAALDAADNDVMIVLENTAGQGKELGYRFEELAYVLEQVTRPERVAFCLDTCHAFGAGYDVSTRDGMARTLDSFDERLGIDRLKVIHANDSKYPLGSKRDRHEHLGKGYIGLQGFEYLFERLGDRDLPVILETPVDKPEEYAEDLAILKRYLG